LGSVDIVYVGISVSSLHILWTCYSLHSHVNLAEMHFWS
jgi:hypothetical protein